MAEQLAAALIGVVVVIAVWVAFGLGLGLDWPLRVSDGADGRPSTSKFQFFLWTANTSLGRVRATFDFPVVTVPAMRPPSARPSRRVVVDPTGASTDKAVGDGTPWRQVTLGHLINAGLVRVPLDIERQYRGTDLRARIEGAGRIVFGAAAYDSLSTAGGMARKTVVGETPGRAYPQANEWTFWQYRAGDGTLHPLDELRRDLFERKVVSIDDGRRTG